MILLMYILLAQLVIIVWSWRADRYGRAIRAIKRRLARLHRLGGHAQAFELVTEIDAILWVNSINPKVCGIDSLNKLYALGQISEERYRQKQ